ncbi:histidinol-phosphate transaminase [Microbacterium sp. LRZ72]|uniref:histidinol-phosphate transaminase n=1 Tax=Microbacterium sp. LRZ72 TaxID=2942481 RepID=UPI0029BC6DE1|nr:histidinol-phosphate transaminase [Microbacterium sp. LRZ72]MDX2376144.1 histidinol-phosphate transaminase [Microbacterium sp. LRZ72]
MSDSPAAPPVRLRPEIAALPAYKQGRHADAAAYKLSSNENPFAPLPGVLAAIAAADDINRYPDAAATRLRQALAGRWDVEVDAVHVAAGSVSILSQLLSAVAGPGDEIVYAWRSFEAYPLLVTVTGAASVTVPVSAEGRHDLDAMAAAVGERTRAVLVCSPNNPTGPAVHRDELEAFLARVPADVLVVLDEAYAEFVTDPRAVDGLSGLPYRDRANVVVLRTFSKAYGLAGLRIGYAIGDPRVLDAARSTAIPLSVTGHAEVAALASLECEDQLLERVHALARRRDELAQALRDAGWRVPDAQGNFVWLAAGEQTMDVAAAFDAGGIVVRPFAGDGIRISVGEEESVEKVVRIAASVVENLPPEHEGRALAWGK